jgi:CRISPR-associated protein Csm4
MQSDTLFGHLAWHVARRDGPEAVAEFLMPFLDGDPPFILSDAFPAGLLPRPLLPFTGRAAEGGRDAYAEAKRRGKAPFIRAKDFPAVAAGTETAPEPVSSPWMTLETPHASIDRNTWTTTPGGQFFLTEAETLANGFDSVDVYIRAVEGWANRVTQLLRDMAPSGFGRDKSVGYGAYEVTDLKPIHDFGQVDKPDSFISLSTFMPAAADPIDGRWRIRVKRGYLGEMAGEGNPFKRPLIQFEPGAAFRAPQGLAPFYGRMVAGVAPGMPEAVQCGYTLSAPCRWPV